MTVFTLIAIILICSNLNVIPKKENSTPTLSLREDLSMINNLTATNLNRTQRQAKYRIQRLIINAAMLVSVLGLGLSVVSTSKLMANNGNNQIKRK
ncbi:unnamed protein product [Brachionus calyciflorus]|uniref:Uncharacterized protein n=1 Tax=Brachionus calyciflorus TaxID=104777 RepID=A0A813T9A3_9BILA|nr:unnamed protein product [Brachionus calyciflorus]